jgi:pilus assembly protein CpaC
VKRLFPGENIEAQSSGKGIVLSGLVSTKEVLDKAGTVAGGYVDKADEVVNMLRVQESNASNQVLLRVRFAEVSRSAITDLGASLFTGANGYKDITGRSTSGTTAPSFDDGKLVFSDFLNLFLFDAKHQLGTVIKALQTKGQFQSLAEPNLVAESGKEASFLAGGEFPVPVAQGSGANTTISVQYKEFGVRLNFTPVIHGDRVHLKVRPEVSTLDFANGVMLQGFRIPALSTRRTDTEVDLQDGQTFAIAGLMNNTMSSTLQKIPGIGDIPILGLLFKSKAANKDQTELVVMITPQILTRDSSGGAHAPEHTRAVLAPMPAETGRPAAAGVHAARSDTTTPN